MKNKAASNRYEGINHCLRNTRSLWNTLDINEYVNAFQVEHGYKEVSEKQTGDDIRFMKKKGAPIKYYKLEGKGYWKYEEADYSWSEILFEDDDLQQLMDVGQLMKEFNFLNFSDDWDLLITKLTKTHNLKSEKRPFLQIHKPPKPKGAENLRDLYTIGRQGKTIKVKYRKFGSEAADEYNLHPYLILWDSYLFYMLAWCEEKGEMRTYALDRMVSITTSKLKYRPCPLKNPADYYKDVIGITVYPDAKVEEVIIHCSAFWTDYMMAQPWHHSQEIIKDYPDGSTDILFRLKLNPELTALIFSKNKEVKVLAPQCLVEDMREKVRGMWEMYSGELSVVSGEFREA
jgi:predicted DNA-binding transcriptional regulator YafY